MLNNKLIQNVKTQRIMRLNKTTWLSFKRAWSLCHMNPPSSQVEDHLQKHRRAANVRPTASPPSHAPAALCNKVPAELSGIYLRKTPFPKKHRSSRFPWLHWSDTACCGHQRDLQTRFGGYFAATLRTSSMQTIRGALFALLILPVSGSSEAADSCPAVCECSEWRSHTISCFDIDILPRFPASTEIL